MESLPTGRAGTWSRTHRVARIWYPPNYLSPAPPSLERSWDGAPPHATKHFSVLGLSSRKLYMLSFTVGFICEPVMVEWKPHSIMWKVLKRALWAATAFPIQVHGGNLNNYNLFYLTTTQHITELLISDKDSTPAVFSHQLKICWLKVVRIVISRRWSAYWKAS